MECNKEEAVRAMELSEKKLQNNDFTGARKMAEKAQRLFPGLENLEKLLAVCEVNCSSETKIGGSEMDWYGILHIKKSDNDVTIKKQYRKFALLLHPDKNKFAGAEAAFKLIGEANRVLTDQTKRTAYEFKCRAAARTGTSKSSVPPSNGNLFVRKNNNSASNSQTVPQSQPTSMNQHEQMLQNTFWTCCPDCKVKYQYFKDFINKLLRCQRCRKAFIALDLGVQFQAVNAESVTNQFPKEPPSQGTSNVASQSNGGKNDIEHDVRVGMEGVKISKSGPVKSEDSGISRSMNKKRARNPISESGKPLEQNGGNPHRKSSRKKQNLSYKENVNDDDDFVSPPKRSRDGRFSSATEKERKNAAVDGGFSKNDGSTDSATTAAMDGHKEHTKQNGTAPLEDRKRSKTGDVGSGPNSNVASMPDTLEVPDPDFHKFVLDEDTLKSTFRANQTWALYDPVDGMPRFYARISKVFATGFKLRITWLEANPDDEGEIAWCNKDLPVACGKYILGNSDEVTDHLMFSHQVHCIKGRGRSSFIVYPRVGETWALYQNWDMGWSSDPEKHEPYKFEFVEVLSDFDENNGVGVAYLSKVKGFVSLFQRSAHHGVVSFIVPPNELYRFSHRIPSFQMTGAERDGVPIGSFEFDPASLPCNLEDFSDVRMDNKTKTTEPVTDSGRTHAAKKQETNCSGRETSKHRSPRSSNSEFGNSVKPEATHGVSVGNGIRQGKQTRRRENSAPCQASDGINTPKKHQRIDSDRETSVLRRSSRANRTTKCQDSANSESETSSSPSTVNSTSSQSDDQMHSSVKGHPSVSSMNSPVAHPFLTPACRLSQTQFYDFDGQKSEEKFQLDQIWALYSDKNGMPKTYAQVKRIEREPNFQLHMALLEPCLEPKNKVEPVCCGEFKVKCDQTKVFSRTSISHCLQPKSVGKTKKIFELYPRKGEVWALYKNHNPESTCSKNDECDIVEVLEDSEQSTKVVVMAQLNGFKTVYRRQRIQKSQASVLDIPRDEVGRFSHQIPAFHHTMNSDTRVVGCWELDPVSIPGSTIVRK